MRRTLAIEEVTTRANPPMGERLPKPSGCAGVTEAAPLPTKTGTHQHAPPSVSIHRKHAGQSTFRRISEMRRARGFTLIELLVVIAIIAIEKIDIDIAIEHVIAPGPGDGIRPGAAR